MRPQPPWLLSNNTKLKEVLPAVEKYISLLHSPQSLFTVRVGLLEVFLPSQDAPLQDKSCTKSS